jgi:hypothetical protein
MSRITRHIVNEALWDREFDSPGEYNRFHTQGMSAVVGLVSKVVCSHMRQDTLSM